MVPLSSRKMLKSSFLVALLTGSTATAAHCGATGAPKVSSVFDANGKRIAHRFRSLSRGRTAWLQDCSATTSWAMQASRCGHATTLMGGDRFVAMFDTWSVEGFYDGTMYGRLP